MNTKRVCILGGSGFVGHRIANRLTAEGYQCRILTRHPQRHKELEILAGMELIQEAELSTENLARHFKDCYAVINLIGVLNEGKDQRSFQHIHVDLVDTIVEAGRQAGIQHLLHMSALNADEASGASHYLRTKGEGENHAHTHGQPAFTVTSFRPSVIFGVDDSFFNRFAGLLKILPGPFPLACPNTRFAPVYAGDVAEAFVTALSDKKYWNQRYDLCGPKAYTLKELVEYTAITTGADKSIMSLSDGLSRLQAKVLGWLPGKLFTTDNYLSLQTDSTCKVNGLLELGITPTAIETLVPLYLSSATSQRGRYSILRSRKRDLA